jgi:transcriptional regulator with XRE-family HTH domain
METDLRLKLAARIRELRKKYKYTQWELSDLSDVDYKHIQLLESKKRCDVKLSTLTKLAKAFNISVSKLLDFK